MKVGAVPQRWKKGRVGFIFINIFHLFLPAAPQCQAQSTHPNSREETHPSAAPTAWHQANHHPHLLQLPHRYLGPRGKEVQVVETHLSSLGSFAGQESSFCGAEGEGLKSQEGGAGWYRELGFYIKWFQMQMWDLMPPSGQGSFTGEFCGVFW